MTKIFFMLVYLILSFIWISEVMSNCPKQEKQEQIEFLKKVHNSDVWDMLHYFSFKQPKEFSAMIEEIESSIRCLSHKRLPSSTPYSSPESCAHSDKDSKTKRLRSVVSMMMKAALSTNREECSNAS